MTIELELSADLARRLRAATGKRTTRAAVQAALQEKVAGVTDGKQKKRRSRAELPSANQSRARLRAAKSSGMRLKVDERLAAAGISESDLWGL